MQSYKFFLLPCSFFLLLTYSLSLPAQTLRINEVVASNSILKDRSGNKPDWIELYNPGNSAVDLTGFGIADTNDAASAWKFSSGEIPAKGYLLIFASKDDIKEIVGYENITRQGDSWKYLVPDFDTPADWFSPEFDDAAWLEGPTGIGYGAGDDETITQEDIDSFYARKTFQLSDLNSIREIVLDIDYDDAFVAYLNGVEVARANIGTPGVVPRYSDNSFDYHNPLMINGLPPEKFSLSEHVDLLKEGKNVLAIQVHNRFRTSTLGLSLIPFLTLGRVDAGFLPDTLGDLLDLYPNHYHTDFKISSSGETLYLFRPDGQIEDTLGFPYLLPNISVGRPLDETAEPVFFTTPTPGEINSGEQFEGMIEDVITFSHGTGSYSEEIVLSLSHQNSENLLTYTTDGSLPTESSAPYSGPISVDSTMVIRANVFRAAYLSPPESNRTYLVEDPSEVATISLISDSVNLWDEEYGLYALGANADSVYPYTGANFWQDWERPAFFSLIGEDGELQYESAAGMKIAGNYSRGRPQKSFSLFARKQYGTSTFEHRFFPIRPYEKYESILIRNTGSDWARGRMRDVLITSLMQNSHADFQAHVPIRLFINGHYWGNMYLREKISEHMYASLHNSDPDGVTLLKSNAVPLEGDPTPYLYFISQLESKTMQTEEDREFVEAHIDVDNFLQYNIAQVYTDNRDWPNNNLKYWKAENGKWKWVLFDTDYGFGMRDIENYKFNTLAFALEDNGPAHPNPPWSTFLFRKVMENESFRNRFINQYADDLNSRFLTDRVLLHIDTLLAKVTNETIRHLNRWGEDVPNWEEHTNRMKVFAEERSSYARAHILSEFGLASMQTIHTQLAQLDRGHIQLNSLKLEEENWSGQYFEGVPIILTAMAKPGYAFEKWTGDVNSTDASITLDLTSETTVIAHFKETPFVDYGIVINEINYNSSKDFATADWIELTNTSDQAVDLSGWVFKDGNDEHAFVIPDATILEPNAFLLLCRDKKDFGKIYPSVKNQIGNFDFGLSKDGENLRLYDLYGYMQDSVWYLSDNPWPGEPNGSGATLSLINSDSDNALAKSWESMAPFGTPGKVNLPDSVIAPVGWINLAEGIRVFPNPTSGELHISLADIEDAEIMIHLYSPVGQRLGVWTAKKEELSNDGLFDLDISLLQTGLYYLKINTESETLTSSLLKL